MKILVLCVLFLLPIFVIPEVINASSLDLFNLATLDVLSFQGEYVLHSLKGLEQYDGHDDKPAYIAAMGKIYDFTDLSRWSGGTHMRLHQAGKELTSDLISDSPHGEARLSRGDAVGLLVVTSTELREHGGGNNKKLYVAVSGKVYDVSSLRSWSEGIHAEMHKAGQEMTTELLHNEFHDEALLDEAIAIGINAFTPSELAFFDGTDSKKFFIAFEGKVFDVSKSKGWLDAGKNIVKPSNGLELTTEILENTISWNSLDDVYVVGILVLDSQELSKFIGTEGKKAYVSYKGKVYDITSVESTVDIAGTDITNVVDTDPMLKDIIENAPVVGFMINEEE